MPNFDETSPEQPVVDAALGLCGLAGNTGILECLVATSPDQVRAAVQQFNDIGYTQLAKDLEDLYLRIFGDSPSDDGFTRDDFVASMTDFPGVEIAAFDNQYRRVYSDIIHKHEPKQPSQGSQRPGQTKELDSEGGEIRFKRKAKTVFPNGLKKGDSTKD